MAVNLLELMGNALSGDLADRIGATVGAEPQTTRSALDSALPAILGGLLQKGSSPQGAGQLLDLLTRGNHDALLGNLAGALDGSDAGAKLLRTGADLLPSLFGTRADAIAGMIAGNSGMSRESSSSLLGLLTPLVLGFVTKQLRASGGLNLSALTKLLAGQRGFLEASAPPGLVTTLGLGGIDELGSGIDKLAGAAADGAAALKGTVPPASGGWLKWIIGLIVLGLLLFLFRGCPERAVGPEPAPPSPVIEPETAQ